MRGCLIIGFGKGGKVGYRVLERGMGDEGFLVLGYYFRVKYTV